MYNVFLKLVVVWKLEVQYINLPVGTHCRITFSADLQVALLRHSMARKTWSDIWKPTLVGQIHMRVSVVYDLHHQIVTRPLCLQVRSHLNVSCVTRASVGGTSSTCTAARTQERSRTSVNTACMQRRIAAVWRNTSASTMTSGLLNVKSVRTQAATPASSPCTFAHTQVGSWKSRIKSNVGLLDSLCSFLYYLNTLSLLYSGYPQIKCCYFNCIFWSCTTRGCVCARMCPCNCM